MRAKLEFSLIEFGLDIFTRFKCGIEIARAVEESNLFARSFRGGGFHGEAHKREGSLRTVGVAGSPPAI